MCVCCLSVFWGISVCPSDSDSSLPIVLLHQSQTVSHPPPVPPFCPKMPNSVIVLLIHRASFFQIRHTVTLHDLLTCAPHFSESVSVSCLPAETVGCLIFLQESDDWCGGGGAWLVVWKTPLALTIFTSWFLLGLCKEQEGSCLHWRNPGDGRWK